MALKAKIANKPKLDDKGYCTGVIESILDIEEREEKQGKKTIKFAAQFEFIIISDGSHKPITYRFWTGQNINSEKFKNEETDTKDYNRLTRVCLQLGLIKESDLSAIKDDKLPDLEQLEGIKIKFKLEPSRKNQALQVPDISSLEIVK
ncbi:MAG: hypothetical protein ACKPE3_11755 [Sphaerospermopsis kisseleviana]